MPRACRWSFAATAASGDAGPDGQGRPGSAGTPLNRLLEDRQGVGLHVRGAILSLLTAIVLLLENRGAAAAEAADQRSMEHHTLGHRELFTVSPLGRRSDAANGLRDEMELVAELPPLIVARLVLRGQ